MCTKLDLAYHLSLGPFQDIFLNTFACDKPVDVDDFLLANSMSSAHCLDMI